MLNEKIYEILAKSNIWTSVKKIWKTRKKILIEFFTFTTKLSLITELVQQMYKTLFHYFFSYLTPFYILHIPIFVRKRYLF